MEGLGAVPLAEVPEIDGRPFDRSLAPCVGLDVTIALEGPWDP